MTREFTINAECMKDFCGSFGSTKSESEWHDYIYRFPTVIETTMKDLDNFTREKYHMILKNTFEKLLSDDFSANCAVEGWMYGNLKVEDFSKEDVKCIFETCVVTKHELICN